MCNNVVAAEPSLGLAQIKHVASPAVSCCFLKYLIDGSVTELGPENNALAGFKHTDAANVQPPGAELGPSSGGEAFYI